MVDNVNPTDDGNLGVVDSRRGVAGYLATTAGKIVVGGVVLLVVIGVLAVMFMTFFGSNQNGSGSVGKGTVVRPAASSTATSQPPVEPVRASLSDSFTYRPNIFAPSVSLPASVTASAVTTPALGTTGDGGSALSVPTVPANTLFLQSIQAVNDANKATLIWNGEAFVVGAGQVVGDTPWKVLSISDTSVVMLFGDDRVTISVGQGLSK